MSLPKDQAWFAAKRYGYGWGLPNRWQGWLVVGGYFTAMAIAAVYLVRPHPMLFIGCTVVLSTLFVGACAWKGESPRWRWGEKKDNDKTA